MNMGDVVGVNSCSRNQKGNWSVYNPSFQSLQPFIMNVPFISSGALSRNHYTLVRKVEDSNSEDSVSRILDAEVKSIRERLARPNLPPVCAISF